MNNSINTFNNLCKIFEMRIKLDKEKHVKTSSEVLDNYAKYTKKIDDFYNEEFQKTLKPLILPAKTLEKEKERLEKLIKLLEDRLCKRINLEDKFYETTGKMLDNLQIIVSDEELDCKRERLNTISNYLDTNNEIEELRTSIDKLKEALIEAEDAKDGYLEKNKSMEDELYSSFVNILKENGWDTEFDENNIGDNLENIRISVKEAKETLDITKESIGTLIDNGEDDDYNSYIDEAERNYYLCKNKEIIYKIYYSVITFTEEFSDLYDKNINLAKLLKEKHEIEDRLPEEDRKLLTEFEKILNIQARIIVSEKDTIENITNYSSRIEFKEERLASLEEVNKDSDILSILSEYGLADTYDTDDFASEEIEEEEPVFKEKVLTPNPNRIVNIKDYPLTFNAGLAKLKGENIKDEITKKLTKKGKKEDEKKDSPREKVNNWSINNDLTWNIPEEIEPKLDDLEHKVDEINNNSAFAKPKEDIIPIFNMDSIPFKDANNPVNIDSNLNNQNVLDMNTVTFPAVNNTSFPKKEVESSLNEEKVLNPIINDNMIMGNIGSNLSINNQAASMPKLDNQVNNNIMPNIDNFQNNILEANNNLLDNGKSNILNAISQDNSFKPLNENLNQANLINKDSNNVLNNGKLNDIPFTKELNNNLDINLPIWDVKVDNPSINTEIKEKPKDEPKASDIPFWVPLDENSGNTSTSLNNNKKNLFDFFDRKN